MSASLLLLEGDNEVHLQGLVAAGFEGLVELCYLDPPYNTGKEFITYSDKNSTWLADLEIRLRLISQLLAPTGVLLLSIDDNEVHYLKVLCDQVLGRSCFVTGLVWVSEGVTDNQGSIKHQHEHILVYSKSGKVPAPPVVSPSISKDSKVFRSDVINSVVKNGPKNPQSSIQIPCGFPASFEEGTLPTKEDRYPIFSEDLVVRDYKLTHSVTATSGWCAKEQLQRFIEGSFVPILDTKGQETTFLLTHTGAIESRKKRGVPSRFLSVLTNLGSTNQARLELEAQGLFFSYPKPVQLLEFLLEAFSSPDGLVLDPYAGSGTTGKALQNLKSPRQGILIEALASNATLIRTRLGLH